MTTFRRFEFNDANKISRCNLDQLTETYDVGFYLQYYAKWPSLFYVCEDDQKNIIGYIMGKIESSPDAYKNSKHYLPWHAHITALTVAPEARRLGIGKILTELLEAAADANAAWFMDLFVRRSNLKAISFYENLGYRHYLERIITPQPRRTRMYNLPGSSSGHIGPLLPDILTRRISRPFRLILFRLGHAIACSFCLFETPLRPHQHHNAEDVRKSRHRQPQQYT
ncbi:N-acetyltransferase 5 [Ophiocordyceps camponoti-floridani]|uniref:N-acetyltransferase 5 n=1 Tax=Ophiocordyceps camponoti-floridani TaxID=2030778 RepID=A0A8H4VBP3_9HYPO|nr:N-acetyltransferase 5 [Ophiocordyceps camponoti-floridani]